MKFVDVDSVAYTQCNLISPALHTTINPLSQLSNEHHHVLNKIDNMKSAVIIAGHYCLAEHMQELSSNGDAEVMCFELGAQLFSRALKKGITHHLVVWVNDIGINQKQREEIKRNFTLPDNYLHILELYKIKPSQVTVMFEGSMRNKASTLVKKIQKNQPGRLKKVDANCSDLVRCIQNSACDTQLQEKNHVYIIDGPNNEQLVIKEGPAPKCNLILATFFSELLNLFTAHHFINVFNDVYTYRLRLGIHVSYSLLNNSATMTNLLCDGEKIKCDIFEHNRLKEAVN